MLFNKKTLSVVGFILIAIMILFLTLNSNSPATNSQNTVFNKVVNSQKIKVGYLTFPPIITKDPNTGELGGHVIATIKEIAKQTNWEIEFIETDWTGFSAGLKSGRFDLSIVPTFTTIPRSVSVTFSKPLFYAGNSAIIRKDDKRFTDIMSFDKNGITISVTQGEAGHEFAKNNFTKAKLKVLPGPDQTLTLQDVVSGRSDIALGDAHVTEQFAKKHPKVSNHFANNPYNLTPVSWSVKHGETDMLNFINNAILVLESQKKLLKYEHEAGANWLHLQHSFVLE